MRKYFSDEDFIKVLGADLSDSDVIDMRIEEAYAMIRNAERKVKKKTQRKKKHWKGIGIGLVSAAAVLTLTFTFCVTNPVMAKEIPILGGIFEKMADIFSFGKLPEDEVTQLYTAEGEDIAETTGDRKEPYQKSDNGITVTLTEEYATNQALFIGLRVENEQGFPEMQVFTDGTQQMQIDTNECYSFRRQGDELVGGMRNVQGKFEDSKTFIGIMRIDYSEINIDSSKYDEACREAEARGEDGVMLTAENYDDYMEIYKVPESFSLNLEITRLVSYLANPTKPEGMKSGEELEAMTHEEWVAYMESLPGEWTRYPNQYEHWFQEGSWEFDLEITQRDSNARIVTVNETNDEGIGLESLEISSVEMTVNTISPADRCVYGVVLDADGKLLENGSENTTELAVVGHDISAVYVYVCDAWEYFDSLKSQAGSEDFQEILEKRALFKTVVYTGD